MIDRLNWAPWRRDCHSEVRGEWLIRINMCQNLLKSTGLKGAPFDALIKPIWYDVLDANLPRMEPITFCCHNAKCGPSRSDKISLQSSHFSSTKGKIRATFPRLRIISRFSCDLLRLETRYMLIYQPSPTKVILILSWLLLCYACKRWLKLIDRMTVLGNLPCGTTLIW